MTVYEFDFLRDFWTDIEGFTHLDFDYNDPNRPVFKDLEDEC